jgi:hypothetical protein
MCSAIPIAISAVTDLVARALSVAGDAQRVGASHGARDGGNAALSNAPAGNASLLTFGHSRDRGTARPTTAAEQKMDELRAVEVRRVFRARGLEQRHDEEHGDQDGSRTDATSRT